MKRTITYCVLVSACGVLVLLGGCFPEDSLDWSADGSVGLLRTDEGLYLVDGQTGKLTCVQAENVAPWPGLARDGARIIYSDEAACATLAEGLGALPASQVRMIERDARALRERILSGVLTVTDFNSVPDEALGYEHPYRSWVVRHLCEHADEPLGRKLGDQLLEQGKKSTLKRSRLIVVSRAEPDSRQVVTTSVLRLVRPRFSPDGRYVAYLALWNSDDDQAHLFVAALHSAAGGPTVHVASRVALGFDWRPDSRALAYLQQEAGDTILGVIFERQICNDNGLLEEISAESLGPGAPGLAMHRCTGPARQLVGTLFEPLMKVQYGVGGRLFFSSASGRIPTSDLDEPKYLLFCYDSVTGAVADVLPAEASSYVGQTVNFFSLSPDGRRVLLPMAKNRFALYELGSKSVIVPITEAEQFGEDLPEFLPSWKGNDAVSCLVAQNSHFLTDEQRARQRKEIVVLDAAGDLQSVLSADWSADTIE